MIICKHKWNPFWKIQINVPQILNMKVLLIFFLFSPVFLWSQNNIQVHVANVPSEHGKVNVAVYDSDKTFLKFDGVVQTQSLPASEDGVDFRLEGLPPGEYALAVFHDANGNNKLDKNWLGIPTEKVAFSKGKMKTFGPPSYRECCFKVEGDTQVTITF